MNKIPSRSKSTCAKIDALRDRDISPIIKRMYIMMINADGNARAFCKKRNMSPQTINQWLSGRNAKLSTIENYLDQMGYELIIRKKDKDDGF